jgi:aminopeptidase 2
VASLDIKVKTSAFTFNASELYLDDASIYCGALQKREQVASSREFDGASERATLHFSTPLPTGSKAQLRITFHGELSGSMLGYYLSSWEHEGRKEYYALTQFEVSLFVREGI